jgi:hypothetical protein
MKYYCWRCDSVWELENPDHHKKLHEMQDDMSAYGVASCNLQDLGFNIDSKVEVKPDREPVSFIPDKRKVSTFKEDEI